MTDWFGEIPNAHPPFVPFPVALLISAAALDLVAIFARREGLSRCAGLMLLLALAGGVAAIVTGMAAEEQFEGQLDAATMEHVEAHEHFALASGGVLIGLVVWRGINRFRYPPGWQKYLYALVVTVAAALVGYTAHLGGTLVFGHGVGVQTEHASHQTTGHGE